jgi:hypothetical protein
MSSAINIFMLAGDLFLGEIFFSGFIVLVEIQLDIYVKS